jgi:hypothetical protein
MHQHPFLGCRVLVCQIELSLPYVNVFLSYTLN